MRVLMFGWEFPPHISGGLGTACYGLTQGVRKQGVEILFVVPKTFGGEPDDSTEKLLSASQVTFSYKKKQDRELLEKLTYIEVGSFLVPYMGEHEFEKQLEFERRRKDSSWDEQIFQEYYEFSGRYTIDLHQEVARYALVASKIASNEYFDVIHAHDWLTFPAGIAAKKATGKPLVVHVHATEFDRSGETVNQQVYDLEKTGMEMADTVITVSELTRQVVINRYGIDPEKVKVVHNAVLPTNVYQEDVPKAFPEKLVSFLGRITFQKGPDYFVEAANLVIKKDPNVRFAMAGSGDMLNKMIRRVAGLGIGEYFHFAGFLKGSEVYRLLGMSDVYVMPSVSEPFGISTLEAIQSSTPVIISRQSGVSEVLSHAIKVDFWDVEAMADAIHALLHYKGISKMFRHYGKQEVENMKWEQAGIHVNKIYESLMQS